MRRPPVTAAALALAAAVLARGDELGWSLGDETWRYDLVVRAAPDPPPSPGPVVFPLLLVAQEDLAADGRTPSRPVRDVGDLVWHYALLLPAGDAGRRERSVPFEDAFDLGGALGEVTAKGAHTVQLRGRRAIVRTEAALRAAKADGWLKGGRLLLERVFDARAGRLGQAACELVLEVQGAGEAAPSTRRWSYEIAPAEAIDAAKSEFAAEVQGAIARGAGWLERETNKRVNAYKAKGGGKYALGRVALPTFALLRSGVEPDDVAHLFAWLERQPLRMTYSVSLYLMALEARTVERQALPPRDGMRSVARYRRGDPDAADLARMEACARWLLAARQREEGWWSYDGKPVEGLDAPRPRRGSRERGERPLGDPADLDGAGPIGHGGADAEHGDRSNSQFAVLALHSALASGIELPPAVWEEVAAEGLRAQAKSGPDVPLDEIVYAGTSPFALDPRDVPADPDGTRERGPEGRESLETGTGRARGWSYTMGRRGSAYGSMSAAGISSLAAAREALEAAGRLTRERDRESLAAIRDGLAWFVLHFEADRNPQRSGNSWYYYYLYSVEKAMDLTGVEVLGAHEWWRAGAAELLARQEEDGSWGTIEATSFALLFLNRATLPAELEIEAAGRVETGGRDPSLWDQVTVEGVGQVQLRQVLTALLEAGPRRADEHLELAEEALAAADPLMVRPRLVPELAELIGSRDRNVRRWAISTCRELAGTTDPDALDRFARDYERLRVAWESMDHRQVGAVRAMIRDGGVSWPLRRAALLTLSRLGGVEGVDEVLAVLADGDRDARELAAQVLRTLAPRAPDYDATGPASIRSRQLAELRAWWAREGGELVRTAEVRRLIRDLSHETRAAGAAGRLAEIGDPAVRPLIDALRAPSSRARAHDLLKAITEQDLPPEAGAWLDWYE